MIDAASALRCVPSPENASATSAPAAAICPFCLEGIKPGASLCKHCGGALSPVHQLVLAHASLEARLVAVETDLAELSLEPRRESAVVPEPPGVPSAPRRAGWPHMLDNLFLGLAALLAAHWLASTVPHEQQAVYRLVALGVALPFGFRYESYARAGTSAQVAAALFFGVLGALLITALDAFMAGSAANVLALTRGRDVAETITAIGLSHLTGSWLAWWLRREERRKAAIARCRAISAGLAVLLQVDPKKLKGQITVIHELVDTSAPIAAAAASAWAAFGRLL
jgi:hypothetical protein